MLLRCVFCVLLGLLVALPGIGTSAPNSERSNVARQLAARVGKVVGAASGCQDISRSRIKAITDKFTTVVKNLGANDEDRIATLQIFENSLTEGQKAVAEREADCASAERDLANLEHAATLPATPQTAAPAPAVSSPPPPQSSPPPAPAPAPQLAAISPESAIRGVTGKEIRFGMAAAFTGPAKELGRQMRLGIETAFNKANDAGGVQGRQLRLVTADDGYEPARTAEAMKQLYEKEQVFGIIGNVGTPTAMVAVPYALEHRMLFFGGFTGANVVRRDPPDRYVFNYRASYAEETDSVVRYLVRVKHVKTAEIAVFAQQDAFGDSGFAGVAKAVRAVKGVDSANILRLNYKRNTIDVAEAIAQLKASKTPIKAVVMVATYRAAAKFVEKTRDAYPSMIYTNVSFVGSTSLADELMLLGGKFAKGVIVTQVVPAVEGYSSLILDYKAALAKYFPGEAADYVSLEGFVAANVLIEALNRTPPPLDTEKLVDTLENLRAFDMGLGTLINFGKAEHQGSHKVWATELDNAGHYQPIDLD